MGLRRMGRWVKRFLIIVAGLTLLCVTLVFAAEKTTTAPTAPSRVPEMSTAGKVLELSGTVLKIERTMKGSVETMEFSLEKPFSDIAVGDQIMVSYREKGGRNILIRVAPAKKTAVQTPKKESPTAAKPAGKHLAQLGAYSSKASAESAWQKLSSRYPAQLKSLQPHYVTVTGAKPLVRLQVSLPTAERVHQLCAELKQKSQACIPLS